MSPSSESTPLLLETSRTLRPESEHLLSDKPNLDDVLDEDCTPTWTLITHEFWVILRGSIPVMLAYMLQNSIQTVSTLIVGRASPQDLSTAAFSYVFASSTGWLVGMGGTTALDTLASSTFTGSRNKHDLGILLQRSFVVLTLLYLLIAGLWVFSEPVLLAFGQDARLSRDTARFLTCLIPGGLGYLYFEIMKKYLQAQGIMRPGSYVLLITSPLSALLHYLFVYVAGWGLFAAPFAVGIGYWASFLGLVLYCKFVAGAEHWGGWSKRCLQNTAVFARLAMLGIISLGTEWWAFEVIALAAGRLGDIPLAAQSVIITADQIITNIPLGIGVAASARLGNMLGNKNARGAARSAYTAAALGVLMGSVVLAVLLSTRNIFAKIFNDDPRVIELVSKIIPLVAILQIADGLHNTCGGALRGMGRQHIAAVINIIGYYFVSLPLGIYLAFHGWGLVGLWIGQCSALYSCGGIEMIVVAFTNWDRQVKNAFKRMDGDDIVGDDEDFVSASEPASRSV